MNLWATKSITSLRAEADNVSEKSLRRHLGPWGLTALGIGAIIGAGIFVLTGQAAALHAGPAVPLSMIIVGIACAFAGLCYAEMASAVPVAGSAYTYSYATMGELVAWIIGWDLVLEYAAGAATVGVGWSGHLVSLLAQLGIHIPPHFTNSPTAWCTASQVGTMANPDCAHAGLNLTGAVINLPAVFIVALMSTILVIGIKESASVNNMIVLLKVTIILLIVAIGVGHIHTENWKPFIPPNTGEWGTYGWSGVLRGAGLVFFAYIGFDAVSTAAQEARNPQKDMAKGILGSLAICTLLYVVVSAVLTGMVPYTELNVAAPMALAMERIGAPTWVRLSVDVGAVLGLGSVILVMLLGQSRVFYSMSRDGLLGKWAGAVHPKFRTPYLSTIFTGVAVGVATGMLPLQLLGQLVNIGTLLAFVLVCLGVMILRKKRPELDRPFRTPWVPFVPIMGVLCCLGLMATLPADTWIRLIVWLIIGFVIYFGYSRRHSVLQKELDAGTPQQR
ncbi:MAG TPA: amino acid permease [Gemmatimonadales bacterium]|jgi:APA family basic amino acid/polyamine antiporter|nr:amino acid permease [Gemmatimonadales bacterium]